MARPTFTPDCEQRRTLTALARLAARRAKIDAQMDALYNQGDGQQIPVEHIARAARVQRKTVYRHLGRPMK